MNFQLNFSFNFQIDDFSLLILMSSMPTSPLELSDLVNITLEHLSGFLWAISPLFLMGA